MSLQKRKKMDVRHPIFDEYYNEWLFLINAFEGGQIFLRNNYLFKHLRESKEAFEGRKNRAYYLNYVKMVIDIWSSYVQRTPPKRNVTNAKFDTFSENVDLKGNSLNEFWLSRVFPLVEAVGMVHIVLRDVVPDDVDPDKVVTLQDQNDAGIKTNVLTIKLPQDMVNWKLNVDGTYRWAIFRNEFIHQADWNDEPSVEVNYTIYEPGKETLVDEEGKQLGKPINTGLNFVPVVTIYGRRSEKTQELGIAGMYDVAIINREIFNICSLIQEFLYKQCFNFLAAPEDLLTNEAGKIKISTTGILPIIDSTIPQYVSPPIDPAEFLQTERDNLIQQMYKLSVLRDKSIETKDPASGISKAYDVHETGQFLSNKINALEDGDNAITNMWFKKNGIDKGDIEKYAEYPSEYDIKTLNTLLNEATALYRLNVSETLNKEIAVLIARKALPNTTLIILKKIMNEIKKGGNPADEMFMAGIDSRRFNEKPSKPLKGDKTDEFNQRIEKDD